MFCYIFWQFATFQRNIAVLARHDSVEFCTVLSAVGWHALDLQLFYSLYANARSLAGHFESTLRPRLIQGMGAKTDLKCTPLKTGLIIGLGRYLGWAYYRTWALFRVGLLSDMGVI